MNNWSTSLNLSVLICKIETAHFSQAAVKTERASKGRAQCRPHRVYAGHSVCEIVAVDYTVLDGN